MQKFIPQSTLLIINQNDKTYIKVGAFEGENANSMFSIRSLFIYYLFTLVADNRH